MLSSRAHHLSPIARSPSPRCILVATTNIADIQAGLSADSRAMVPYSCVGTPMVEPQKMASSDVSSPRRLGSAPPPRGRSESLLQPGPVFVPDFCFGEQEESPAAHSTLDCTATARVVLRIPGWRYRRCYLVYEV